MPTVKSYGGRQVSTTALPGARKGAHETATSQGAGLEQARAGIGGAVARIGEDVSRTGVNLYARQQAENRRMAEETRRRAIEVDVLQADNELDQWELRTLHDTKNGALNVQGRDAFGLPEAVDEDFNKTASALEQRLGTPEAKLAFQKIRAQRGVNVGTNVRRHVAGEIQRYESTELKAKVENKTSLAIANARDPRRVGEELQSAVTSIEQYGRAHGLGPEAIQAQVSAVQSQTHIGVISNLLASEQTASARIYFEETRGQIAGDKLDEITEALAEGNLRKTAQQTADRILREGGTLKEQREKARAIEDAEERDAVMTRLEHEAAVNERAERETEEAQSRGVYDILDRTPDVTKIPPGVWSQMTGGQRSAAKSYALAMIEQPGGVETDPGAYYKLRNQAADPATQGDFAKADLMQYRHVLGNTEFKQLVDLQMSLRKGDTAKADVVLGGVRTDTQMFTDTVVEAKLESNSPEAAKLRREWERRVESAQRLGGNKPLSGTEKQEILDNLWQSVVLKPGGWGNIFPGGEPFYETTKRAMDVTVGDIPAADRAAVQRQLKKEGRTGTPEEIVNRYLAAKRKLGDVR